MFSGLACRGWTGDEREKEKNPQREAGVSLKVYTLKGAIKQWIIIHMGYDIKTSLFVTAMPVWPVGLGVYSCLRCKSPGFKSKTILHTSLFQCTKTEMVH